MRLVGGPIRVMGPMTEAYDEMRCWSRRQPTIEKGHR